MHFMHCVAALAAIFLGGVSFCRLALFALGQGLGVKLPCLPQFGAHLGVLIAHLGQHLTIMGVGHAGAVLAAGEVDIRSRTLYGFGDIYLLMMALVITDVSDIIIPQNRLYSVSLCPLLSISVPSFIVVFDNGNALPFKSFSRLL